jgi:ABC-type Fe3+/spermidine/putrescine transport system ATPase subunit
MLTLEHIAFSYGSKPILKNINLTLKQGTVAAVIGESGCGKSTLLDLVYGLLQEKQGNIRFNGEQLLGAGSHLVPGHEMMKYVPQEFDLMPFTTVFENVGEHVSLQDDNRESSIAEMLAIVGMLDFKDRKVKTLSGGQKQRVAIAKALAQQPKVLLMDEPFSHIDNFRKNELRRNLFAYFKKQQMTCIMATHDKDDVLAFTDRTIIMQDGYIIDNRATSAVYKKPKTTYGASLFDDVNVIPTAFFDNKKELLCYPHNLCVNPKGVAMKVAACYFAGNGYLLIVQNNNDLFYVKHTVPVEPETVVAVWLHT